MHYLYWFHTSRQTFFVLVYVLRLWKLTPDSGCFIPCVFDCMVLLKALRSSACGGLRHASFKSCMHKQQSSEDQNTHGSFHNRPCLQQKYHPMVVSVNKTKSLNVHYRGLRIMDSWIFLEDGKPVAIFIKLPRIKSCS